MQGESFFYVCYKLWLMFSLSLRGYLSFWSRIVWEEGFLTFSYFNIIILLYDYSKEKTMILVQDQYCPKNHICPVIRLCPVGAISQPAMFAAPVVDQKKCIDCGKCVRACRTFVRVATEPAQA